jgi:hypothetical protein
MNKLLELKYVEELFKIKKMHIKADNVLCNLLNELNYKELINIYKNI